MDFNKLVKKLVLVFLLICLIFFLAEKIDLTTADLGRHIKNGQMVFKGKLDVLNTCFYSYTHPEFNSVNHHWLGGVIFFIVWQIGQFSGLSVFYIILSLITFLLFFDIARKEVGFKVAGLISLLFLPLIATRTEVRPEIFTYLFSGIFLWILWHIKKKKISLNYLFILPIIEVLWVNTHIYFLIGPGLVFLFLMDSLYNKVSFSKIKKIILAFLLVIVVLFLNPSGFQGVIYPFKVFENFGYRPIENQSVQFLEGLKHFDNINLDLFKVAFLLSLFSFIGLFLKDYKRINITYLILWLGLSFLSWTAIRNFAIFGLFCLPIISYNISIVLKDNKKSENLDSKLVNITYTIIAILIVVIFGFTHYNLIKHDLGVGLKNKVNASANFFKNQDIKGPILNNYDIGGYLIYHLYPKEKIFVDNRPESYPTSFFKNVYIPLQKNETDWKKFNKKYKFNAIFFSHRDATPWGQKFLINRFKDENWVPVFADQYAVIFLKDNSQNKDIIEQYKVPKSRFNIVSYE